MKLHDMKRPERKMKSDLEVNEIREDPYPYGLRITLEDPELAKVGVKVKNLTVDQVINLAAEARIVSLDDRSSVERGNRQSASMVITKLNMTPQAKGNRTSDFFKKQKEGPGR